MVKTSVIPIHYDRARARIVQHNKRRYSIRLENVFWRALENIAGSRQLRLGHLVSALAEPYSGKNFSSYLRSFCMAELERSHFAAGLTRTDDSVLDLLAACPAPGLLLTAERVVIAHNVAFSEWLGSGHPPLQQAPLAAHFQVRPSPALSKADQALAAGVAFSSAIQLVYTAPGRVSLAAARLVALRAGIGPAGTGQGGGLLIWLAPGSARASVLAPRPTALPSSGNA